MTPHDHVQFYLPFADIFAGLRDAHMITENECAIIGPENPTNKATFIYRNNLVEVVGPNRYFDPGTITKFMLLSAVRFKHDYQQTISWIRHELMEQPIDFIRVGTDYYKVITKRDRYGAIRTQLKPWKKDEIKQDHSKSLLSQIPRFDDFIIVPDNKDYKATIGNCYNLYSRFTHAPAPGDIPVSYHFMHHIFGDQIDLGFKYLKIMYERPTQTLPILTLASKERDTGKTTFINWMEMIFGNNSILISPEDLLRPFNSNYATKNVVLIDETFMEKASGVEKAKSLTTAKSINVSQKFVSEYSVPLYMKLILCTNKIRDFMRIDEEEVRFWIREIPTIKGKKNVLIEEQLFAEIPALLYYLENLQAINYDSGSRMVFTKDEIVTVALDNVKAESKSGLYKEIEILIGDYFDNNEMLQEFEASAVDIKDMWFRGNNQITAHYIKKTLSDEAGLTRRVSETGGPVKYYRFGREEQGSLGPDYRTGNPYLFRRNK